MCEANFDRFLDSEVDRHYTALDRTDDEDRECDCCPKRGARLFYGVPLCRACVESPGMRICCECGGFDFVDGPEGPTMCLDCRSIDTDSTPEWEER